jgi:hypothetical protein
LNDIKTLANSTSAPSAFLDEATLVLGDPRIDQFSLYSFGARQGSRFAGRH